MNTHATTQPLQPPIFRIGILGCGNIVQTMHLPALSSLPNISLQWLIDKNPEILRVLNSKYPKVKISDDMRALSDVDGVIIATPPGMHAEHIRFALEHDWNVFVEKPLATNKNDAEVLVALAAKRNLNLSINLNRRFFPSSKALKELIDTQSLGHIKRIHVIDGQRCSGGAGPNKTFHTSPTLSGGGVMIDTGSHMLDLALSLIPPGTHTNLHYEDDGITKIEAECQFQFTVNAENVRTEISGFFSRLVAIPQTITVYGEKGTATTTLPNNDISITTPTFGDTPVIIRVPSVAHDVINSFGASFEEFVRACRNGETPSQHAAKSTLETLDIIDEAYKSKKLLKDPWGKQYAPPIEKSEKNKIVVAVIGAGGFLGARLFDRLTTDSRFTPRAITHSTLGSLALARQTDNIFIGDARDEQFLQTAFSGAHVVINCAMNMRGARKEAIKNTTKIAETVAKIAAQTGVKRCVHISTIAIHGIFLGREKDKLVPDPERSTYAVAKEKSEQAIIRVGQTTTLDTVILRMGHIFGPYSMGWTVGQRDLVRNNSMVRVDAWKNPSNTVFVDNAIDAIIAAINQKNLLRGSIFYVTDLPNKSWAEFYAPLFADEKKSMTHLPNVSYADFSPIIFDKKPIVMQAINLIKAYISPLLNKEHLRALKQDHAHQDVLRYFETIAPVSFFRFIKRVAQDRVPTRGTDKLHKYFSGPLYDLGRVYASSIHIPTEDAVTTLGYSPSMSWEQSQKIITHWLSSIE